MAWDAEIWGAIIWGSVVWGAMVSRGGYSDTASLRGKELLEATVI